MATRVWNEQLPPTGGAVWAAFRPHIPWGAVTVAMETICEQVVGHSTRVGSTASLPHLPGTPLSPAHTGQPGTWGVGSPRPPGARAGGGKCLFSMPRLHSLRLLPWPSWGVPAGQSPQYRILCWSHSARPSPSSDRDSCPQKPSWAESLSPSAAGGQCRVVSQLFRMIVSCGILV